MIRFLPLQKGTNVICMLAYDNHLDALYENFRMSTRTAHNGLHKFCKYVMRLYDARYLCYPTANDIKQLYEHHANVHGFPGLGRLDYMHWKWANHLVA